MAAARVTFGPKEWITILGATLAIISTIVTASVFHGQRLAAIEENTRHNKQQDEAIKELTAELRELTDIFHDVDKRLSLIEGHLGVHERSAR